MSVLHPAKTCFLNCDIQTVFAAHIVPFAAVVATAVRLSKAAALLQIPVLATEQHPRAFGRTVPGILASVVVSKTRFSMLPAVGEHLSRLHIDTVALYGVEAHVCVLQTALQCRDEGLRVLVVVDGIASQNSLETAVAVQVRASNPDHACCRLRGHHQRGAALPSAGRRLTSRLQSGCCPAQARKGGHQTGSRAAGGPLLTSKYTYYCVVYLLCSILATTT